ncbi:MAG: TSUP family transporter [Alphaproteobacteria bacterium]|nr:TSUP family transporter [Alphaproteobacteria bacterium]
MTLVVLSITSFLASFLTLFSGFGLGTLLMPVAAIFFPVAAAVALTALVHLLNSLFKLAVMWRDVHWRVTLVFGLPAVLAAVPGAFLLARLSTMTPLFEYDLLALHAAVTPVKLAAGILLLVFAMAEWRGLAKKAGFSKKWLPVGGLLSGFFGGLSGHQGAFRSAFLLHAGLNPSQFVATNAVIAALVDLARLAVYGLHFSILMVHIDATLIGAAAVAAFAGVIVGRLGVKKVTIATVQKLVAVMLCLLGVGLVSGVI